MNLIVLSSESRHAISRSQSLCEREIAFLNHHIRVGDGPITFTTTPDPLLHAGMCFLWGYKITFCINVFLSDVVFQSRP